MDLLERLEDRVTCSDQQLMQEALTEIRRLQELVRRKNSLLVKIYNCDEAESLPADVKKDIDEELLYRVTIY